MLNSIQIGISILFLNKQMCKGTWFNISLNEVYFKSIIFELWKVPLVHIINSYETKWGKKGPNVYQNDQSIKAIKCKVTLLYKILQNYSI